jgi:hypothetical protein
VFLTGAKRQHVILALLRAAKDQRAYERQHLGYTLDSGQVGAWDQIRKELEAEEQAEEGREQ